MHGFGWRVVWLWLLALIIILAIPMHLPDLKSQVQSVVVSVTAVNDQEEVTGQGNGFFIAVPAADGTTRLLLVTGRHLLLGAAQARGTMSNGTTFAITGVAAEDVTNDLLLLVTDLPSDKVASLTVSLEIPQAGSTVMLANPQQQDDGVGMIIAARQIEDFGTLYQLTTPCTPEATGSPVINEAKKVIGVAAFSLPEGQYRNFAVPLTGLLAHTSSSVQPLADWAAKSAKDWDHCVEGHVMRGRAYLAIGENEAAKKSFEEALRCDPQNALARKGIAHAEHPIAASGTQPMLPNGPQPKMIEATDAAIMVAEAYNTGEKYDKAIEALQAVLRVKPDHERAYIDLGIAYAGQHKPEEAIAAFQHAVKLNPKDPAPQYDLGLSYGDLQRFAESETALTAAIRLKPDYAEAYARLGMLYLDHQRPQDGAKMLEKATKYNPKDLTAQNNLSLAYMQLRRYNEAAAVSTKVLRTAPNDAHARYFLGCAYDGLKQFEKAIPELEQAIKLDPKNSLPHRGLGMVYAKLSRFDESAKELNVAITLNPQDADSQEKYGTVLLTQRKFVEAITALKKATELNPSATAAWGNLGIAYLNVDKYNEAATALETCIRQAPDKALTHYSLGKAYFRLKRYQDAETAYQQAVKIDPGNAEAHYDLGVTYINLMNRNAALAQYEILCMLDKSAAEHLLGQINKYLPKK